MSVFLLKLKLLGYPSWIASETRTFLTDNCPANNKVAQLWQELLQRRRCTISNSNINPHISLAFPACVWSLRAQMALEIQNLSNQFQQTKTYQAVQIGLGFPRFCSLLPQLERGQSNTQSDKVHGGKERGRGRVCRSTELILYTNSRLFQPHSPAQVELHQPLISLVLQQKPRKMEMFFSWYLPLGLYCITTLS